MPTLIYALVVAALATVCVVVPQLVGWMVFAGVLATGVWAAWALGHAQEPRSAVPELADGSLADFRSSAIASGQTPETHDHDA